MEYKYNKYKNKYLLLKYGGSSKHHTTPHHIFNEINRCNINTETFIFYELEFTYDKIIYKFYVILIYEENNIQYVKRYFVLDHNTTKEQLTCNVSIIDFCNKRKFLMVDPITEDSDASILIETNDKKIDKHENHTNLNLIFHIINLIYQKENKKEIILNDSVKFKCNELNYDGKLFRFFSGKEISIYKKIDGFEYVVDNKAFDDEFNKLLLKHNQKLLQFVRTTITTRSLYIIHILKMFLISEIKDELNFYKTEIDNKKIKEKYKSGFFYLLNYLLEISSELKKIIPANVHTLFGGDPFDKLRITILWLIDFFKEKNDTYSVYKEIHDVIKQENCDSLIIIIQISTIIECLKKIN